MGPVLQTVAVLKRGHVLAQRIPPIAAPVMMEMSPLTIAAPSAPEATIRLVPQTAAVFKREQVVARRNPPSLLTMRKHAPSPIAMMREKNAAVLRAQEMLKPRNAALIRVLMAPRTIVAPSPQ